jgi:hypothetical protein
MKEQDSLKMEFLITLNDNIVIQRFFNVKNYNPDARSSYTLYEYLKDFAEGFAYDLKMKTTIYMMDNMDEIMEDASVLSTSMTEGAEVFNIYLKIGDMTICQRQMDAKVYPPKIRYTVDIRPQVKSVLKDLTDIFSTENLNYNYGEISLVG